MRNGICELCLMNGNVTLQGCQEKGRGKLRMNKEKETRVSLRKEFLACKGVLTMACPRRIDHGRGSGRAKARGKKKLLGRSDTRAKEKEVYADGRKPASLMWAGGISETDRTPGAAYTGP